jgi:aspartate/tyrosine/aromatic aminotransferase
MRKRLQKLLEEIAQILDSKEFAEMFPEETNPDEKRVEELRQAVTHLEAEGIPASLGHLKNRHAFTKEEVQRLAKRFPAKLALNQGRTGKRGPVSDLISFFKNETP